MARLPLPGSDDGVWGDVLNTYLEVSHDSGGALKPDAVNASAVQDNSISAAKLAVSGGSDGQVLTKDSGAAGGLQWAPASTGTDDSATFPLSGYGLVAASDNPISFGGTGTINEGNTWLTRVWVAADVSFTKIALAINASGAYSASAVPNQLAWYDDSGVLQEMTPDDSTMWANGNSWYVGTLPTPVPAQGTGRFIYIGFIVGGYSNVSPAWNLNTGFTLLSTTIGSSRRRAMYAGSQTALPSSFDPTSYGTQTGFIPLVGLVA